MSRWELLELAKQTMEGKFGNGEKRRALLGGRYKAVQSVVDYILKLEDERYRKAEEVEDRVRMTKHQCVERAKKEARRNLTGEDLEKCIKALEAWERNPMTE